MQTSSWHHKLFHFHLSFSISKEWKATKKIQKFGYFENENSFLDEIKSIFHSFWKAIIWWKNKNFIKTADTSFKQSLTLLTLWMPLITVSLKLLSIFNCPSDFSRKNILIMSFPFNIELFFVTATDSFEISSIISFFHLNRSDGCNSIPTRILKLWNCNW